jgi:preprotein translocase subunit YajC
MLNIGIFAQQATGPGAAGSIFGSGLGSILMMVGVFVIFYLLLILPESKRRKKLQKEISDIKIGDKILLSSGITGVVDFVGEKTLYVKSLDAKLEVAKEAVSQIIKNQ